MDILFDIGNVLLLFDFKPALESLAGPKAAPDYYEQIIERKDRYEAGKVPVEEYIDWASSLLDFHGSHDEFRLVWNSIFTPNLPMWELANQLKTDGHRLILFSNTNPIHAPYCLDNYEVFRLFDGAVFSHEIGAIKPWDKFYKSSIDMYNLTPDNTLYIDDLPANIEGGTMHGFQSFLYHHDKHDSFLEQFETALKESQLI